MPVNTSPVSTTPIDPWEQFFDRCWDAYEIVLQRRAAHQQSERAAALTTPQPQAEKKTA